MEINRLEILRDILSKDIFSLLDERKVNSDDIAITIIFLLKDYLTKQEFLDFNDILTDRLLGIVDDCVSQELNTEETGVIVLDEI